MYDRCNAIIQCRDGSDEMDCPTHHVDSETQQDELQSSFSLNLSRPSDAKPKSPIEQNVMASNTAQSNVLGQFLNKSQAKGTAGADSGHGGVMVNGRGDTAADENIEDAEEHLHQLSSSVTSGRSAPSSSDSNMAARTYKEKDAYSPIHPLKHDSVSDTDKSVRRLPESEQQGRQKMPDGKITGMETRKMGKDAARLASNDDTVFQQGNLLLSGMVDNSDEQKHDIGNTRPRYPAVDSRRKEEVELDHHGDGKTGGEYRKMAHPKPLFGGMGKSDALPSSLSVDETDKMGMFHHCT